MDKSRELKRLQFIINYDEGGEVGRRGKGKLVVMIRHIIFWNVRGMNDHKKRFVIKGCMAKWKLKVICFQETKVSSFSNISVCRI